VIDNENISISEIEFVINMIIENVIKDIIIEKIIINVMRGNISIVILINIFEMIMKNTLIYIIIIIIEI